LDLSADSFSLLDTILVGRNDLFLALSFFLITKLFVPPPSVSSYVASPPLTLLILHQQNL
jgi:hypothetical protein